MASGGCRVDLGFVFSYYQFRAVLVYHFNFVLTFLLVEFPDRAHAIPLAQTV